MSPGSLRALLTALWLSIAMLVGQQAAALHELAHATDNLGSTKQLPPAQHCDQCLALAGLDAGLGTATFAIPAIAAASPAPPAQPIAARLSAPRLSYRSRAPPSYS